MCPYKKFFVENSTFISVFQIIFLVHLNPYPIKYQWVYGRYKIYNYSQTIKCKYNILHSSKCSNKIFNCFSNVHIFLSFRSQYYSETVLKLLKKSSLKMVDFRSIYIVFLYETKLDDIVKRISRARHYVLWISYIYYARLKPNRP